MRSLIFAAAAGGLMAATYPALADSFKIFPRADPNWCGNTATNCTPLSEAESRARRAPAADSQATTDARAQFPEYELRPLCTALWNFHEDNRKFQPRPYWFSACLPMMRRDRETALALWRLTTEPIHNRCLRYATPEGPTGRIYTLLEGCLQGKLTEQRNSTTAVQFPDYPLEPGCRQQTQGEAEHNQCLESARRARSLAEAMWEGVSEDIRAQCVGAGNDGYSAGLRYKLLAECLIDAKG